MSEHIARKRFGQNFLQDAHIIDSIVRAIRPQADDVVIEIGPGLAALTTPLMAHLSQLHVIEIDRDIVAHLKTLPFAQKLIIHQGDVLRFDFAEIPGQKKIVGNLPYNISTPLLFKLTEYVAEIAEMHFMLQKEVVDRICAAPGGKNYGRLSVMLQYFFAMEKLIDVPPTAFKPAPKVDSAVIRLIPLAGRVGVAHDFNAFAQLVTSAFAMRRKTLRNNLKEIADEADFAALKIDPNMRPEHIAPQTYVALSNFLHEKHQNRR